MAATINVEHADQVKRQDTIRVVPGDIQILPGTNARNPDGKSAAPDYDEKVKKMALSIAIEGQLQPAGVRRDDKHGLIQTFGFTRRDAVELYRQGFTAIDPRDGVERPFHDPTALLWVKVDDCDDTDAFLRSIKENIERNDTTDLQEAKQHEELRNRLGWTDAAIARFYSYTNQNRVAALRRLLTLPEKRQQQVHEGKLALYTALETLKIKDEGEREAILDGALVGDKIDGSAVKNLIRKTQLEAVEKAVEAGTVVELEDKPKKRGRKAANEGSVKRSTSDFRKLCDEICDENTHCKPKVKELFKSLRVWIDGGCQDKTIWNRINAF